MAKEDKAKVSNEQVTDVDAARERIAHRAYELYEQRGRGDGLDMLSRQCPALASR